MAVDDYPSGLNARRHQNKLGPAISESGTGGLRRRPANPRKWGTPRRLACAVLRSHVRFYPARTTHVLDNLTDKLYNLLIMRGFLTARTGTHATTIVYIEAR
jgi:hypothetical protein